MDAGRVRVRTRVPYNMNLTHRRPEDYPPNGCQVDYPHTLHRFFGGQSGDFLGYRILFHPALGDL